MQKCSLALKSCLRWKRGKNSVFCVYDVSYQRLWLRCDFSNKTVNKWDRIRIFHDDLFLNIFPHIWPAFPTCATVRGRTPRREKRRSRETFCRCCAEFPFYTFNAFYVSPFTFVFQLIKAVLMRKITCPQSPSEFLLAGLDTKRLAEIKMLSFTHTALLDKIWKCDIYRFSRQCMEYGLIICKNHNWRGHIEPWMMYQWVQYYTEICL